MNYMKLVNKSKPFEVIYNGIDHTIPEGEFEVVSEFLVNHIIRKAMRWGFDVSIVPNTDTIAVKKVEKVEEPKAPTPPAFSGATTETLPKRQPKVK